MLRCTNALLNQPKQLSLSFWWSWIYLRFDFLLPDSNSTRCNYNCANSCWPRSEQSEHVFAWKISLNFVTLLKWKKTLKVPTGGGVLNSISQTKYSFYFEKCNFRNTIMIKTHPIIDSLTPQGRIANSIPVGLCCADTNRSHLLCFW